MVSRKCCKCLEMFYGDSLKNLWLIFMEIIIQPFSPIIICNIKKFEYILEKFYLIIGGLQNIYKIIQDLQNNTKKLNEIRMRKTLCFWG